MLDELHGALPKPPTDRNAYTLGSIGAHNAVLACLPKGQIGTNSASVVATQVMDTFPSIRFGLMVGIGGGVPPEVRLSDVVVSSLVIQWDLGKKPEGEKFERTGSLNTPPQLLLTALSKLETDNELSGSKIPRYLKEMVQKYPTPESKYSRSASLEDTLFRAQYQHDISRDDGEAASCKSCDMTEIARRRLQDTDAPVVHHGLIASGNMVIKVWHIPGPSQQRSRRSPPLH